MLTTCTSAKEVLREIAWVLMQPAPVDLLIPYAINPSMPAGTLWLGSTQHEICGQAIHLAAEVILFSLRGTAVSQTAADDRIVNDPGKILSLKLFDSCEIQRTAETMKLWPYC